MKHIALVIFDYFEYGGVQKDLDALGKALRQMAAEGDIQLKLTLLCMHNRAAIRPVWCDEITELTPPRHILSNHRRAEWFNNAVAKIKKQKRFDLLVGFNRMANLDFYFAGDDCLKEKYLQRSRIASWLPRGRIFLELEKSVFASPQAGGSAKIFTITVPQQEAYKKHYPACSDERFIMMPPLLADEYFDRSSTADLRSSARQEFNLDDKTLLIIQIAAAFRTKGVDRSLEILGEAKKNGIISNFKFAVVGGTSDSARSEMKKTAVKCGIADDEVIFTGPRQDIRRLLCGADMMLHPARAEATGGVLIEALASGVPVLSSAVCGYNSFITSAASGVIIPEPYSTAAALEALQEFMKKISVLRSNASDYALRSISKEKFQRSHCEAGAILAFLDDQS